VVLLGGWLKGKALLKYLLEAAFEGLSDEGWLKLSRNWGVFFLFLAGAQRSAALLRWLRRLAVGQAVGVPAAVLPVHLHPDPDAAEARAEAGRKRKSCRTRRTSRFCRACAPEKPLARTP
jgi:hypothetical protein